MEISFLLKNKSEYFYNKLKDLSDYSKFKFCIDSGVLPKFPSSLNDRVMINKYFSENKPFKKVELLKRKGFNLLVFTY